MSESRISWPKTLAELLTIIVGVLLALFANNWRDTVRDHAQAKAYEARLDQDVASDIQQYARAAGEAAAIDAARGGTADGDAVVVTASQLAGILTRLRRIPDLEAQIADVRNVMAQREAWYATYMTAAARKLRKVLAGGT
jgi:hypothetical protein